MRTWCVSQAGRMAGSVRVPGDKSISHRAAMLGALARGVTELDGFLASEDCLNTLGAVSALGAKVERSGTRVSITGTGGVFAPPSVLPLDMGNSGTGIRLLCGLLAGHSFETVLTGDASLCSRPMKRIREPLELMGAKLDLTGERGTAPIRIRGGALRGIDYRPPMASAQVKSCVLLAGLFADGVTSVTEARPTRDHTERMLLAMGAEVAVEGLRVSLKPGGAGRLRPLRMPVPGDISSAAFWLCAAAARPGWQVCAEGVGLNPRRTALLEVLRRMGADVRTGGVTETGGEPTGTVVVRGARLRGAEIAGDEIPNLIDEIPAIAVTAALAEGETVVRDAEELRVKESDRIAVMVRNLRRAGVDASERPDGMVVRGGRPKGGAEVESHGDHRVAMSFAILGMHCPEGMTVRDTACVDTSYPGFIDDLKRVSDASVEVEE